MRKHCSQVILENFFEPCVLFLLRKKPNYGYELNKNLKEHCRCQVNMGNLYRGLNRLVKQGYITQQNRKSDIGPDRTVYQITNQGKSYLKDWIINLKKQNQIVSQLIKNYEKQYATN